MADDATIEVEDLELAAWLSNGSAIGCFADVERVTFIVPEASGVAVAVMPIVWIRGIGTRKWGAP